MILKTILIIIGIILLVVLTLLLLLLIIPFKYRLELYNKNGENYGFALNYIILKLKGELIFKPKFSFKLTLLNKTLVDTSVKKPKKKRDSIEDTDFIKHKGLEKEIDASKKEVKKLFLSAKKAELKIKANNSEKPKLSEKDKKRIVQGSNSLIDSFKKLLPRDLIYVIKRIVAEGINVLDKIKPNSCAIDIKYSNRDPYGNGLMMAVAAPLYSILGDKLKIRSNSKEGDIYRVVYTGSPVLITLLGPILRLLFDKKVRAYIFKKK